MNLLRTPSFVFFVFVLLLFYTPIIQSEGKKKVQQTTNGNTNSHTDANHVLLETLGTVSAQGLYLTYMAIGSLADGFVSQAYDKDTTKTIMESYVGLASICKNQLAKLIREGGLSPDDRQILKEIEGTYEYLIKQGESILRFIETSETDELTHFETNRKEAGKRIDKLLNLK
ncbi:MAG: hypothetical protein O9264_01005 [Leptospira sp.]|nr:hypothetical protein [Leptospira sp.]